MPGLAPCRTRLFHEAKRQLQSAGGPGRQILEQLRSGGAEQLRTMLSACERGAVISGEKELQALALWTMDKVAKAYLRACWRLRGALLGDLRVEHGVLKRDPSPLTPQDVLCEQRVVSTGVREQAPAVAMHADPNVSQSLSQPWCDWVQRKGQRARRGGSRARKAFYVVWCGREEGMFYKWEDCMPSVANFPGAKFKGFRTWAAAKSALDSGLADSSIGES